MFLFFFPFNYVEFCTHMIMSAVNNDSFVSSFPVFMTFISFSWLVVARPSSTVLNRNDYIRQSCTLGAKYFSISSLQIILTTIFKIDIHYQIENISFNSLIAKILPFFFFSLVKNKCWIWTNTFSTSLQIIMWLFILTLLMWIILIGIWRLNLHYLNKLYFVKI